ncbi:hypothetical protein M514_01525 [Trichuris suis]|uniref:Uncharacterized protein n=1 Tax=Trichuris suis TaxID=68888 RepID=A0A085MJM6_9BILA|nr:hypothetical protein M513_01525 [Trichuris suis]KFD66528.1 hypothetical protein M514_01525 [Trichuris suis]KHJ49084.1 hypothetical protein D918_00202 [Trichuris suis]
MPQKNSEYLLGILVLLSAFRVACCLEYDLDDLRHFDNHLVCLRAHCPDLYQEYVVEGKFYRAVENIYFRYRDCMKMCKARIEPLKSSHAEMTALPENGSKSN